MSGFEVIQADCKENDSEIDKLEDDGENLNLFE